MKPNRDEINLRRRKARLQKKAKADRLRAFHALTNALHEAGSETYFDHEASTSDGYLKKRIMNATEQMYVRVAIKLYPDLSADRSLELREWRVGVEEATRFIKQVTPL